MTTIITIDGGDNISDSRSDINTNFNNLNIDKLESDDIAGKVNGPDTSVDENIAVFDGVTGKTIKDGGIKTSDLLDKTTYDSNNDGYVDSSERVVFKVTNNTGGLLTKGTVVYPDVTTGIGVADSNFKRKSRVIAMLDQDLSNGASGIAVKLGPVVGIDTSGFVAGQIVHLGWDVNAGKIVAGVPDDGGYHVAVGVIDVVDAVNGEITIDTQTSDITVEVTDTNGFPPDQRTSTTLSIVDGTRTFTITPSGSEFHFYEMGDKYEILGADSVVFTDQEGEHWFYYEDGVLTATFNPSAAQKEDVILNHAFVATIYRDANANAHKFDIFDERHGISMSPQTHVYLHLTRGAQYFSGYGLGNFITDASGDLDTHAQYSVASGTYFDEDISHTSITYNVGDTIEVAYLEGAGANLRVSSQTNFAVLNSPSGRLYYNQDVGGTWQLTEVSNNDFVLYHVFAINGNSKNTIVVMGQNEYPSAGSARSGAAVEISNILVGFDLNETVPIASVIYQTSDGYANSVSARIRTTDEGDDYVDWRTTELAQGVAAASHLNLTDVQGAAAGVTQGHIDDQPQTIAGVKTFSSFPETPNIAPTTDYQVANKKYVDDNVGGGASVSFVWQYDITTTAADPGSGNFRTNNNTISLVNQIYFDDETKNGIDASTLLNALQSGNSIYIQNLEDATEVGLFSVTNVTDNVGWFTIDVTFVDSGVAVGFTNGKECGVILNYSGGTASPLTTKGDIYTYDTGEARLPVGTDDHSLVADSTQATGLNYKFKINSDPTGVTGADQVTNTISLTQAEFDAIGTPDASTQYIITDAPAPGGGGGVSEIFNATHNQAVVMTTTLTTLIFNLEQIDTGNNYDNTTGIYTVPSTGNYQFSVLTNWFLTTDGDRLEQCIYVNGALAVVGNVGQNSSVGGYVSSGRTVILSLTASDTVEVRVRNATAARGNIITASFAGYKL